MIARRTKFRLCMLVFFEISLPMGDRLRAAEPGVAGLPSRTIPTGVYELAEALVIPRQRPLPHPRDKAANGVPAPYKAGDAISYPGGELHGSDQFGSVLRFSPKVTGCLICTEGYGTGKAGGNWNHNGRFSPEFKPTLCCTARDFTVDGGAEFRPYPFVYTPAHPKPDPHGPDMPQRADGLCADGSGFTASRLRFFNIPGTALVVKGGGGAQGGAFGIYDGQYTRLSEIFVHQAINGIACHAGDAKLDHLWVYNVAKVGLLVTGAGTVIENDHICGADIAARFTTRVVGTTLYHESARVGTLFDTGSDGSVVTGLYVGPGTCRERGVVLKSSGVRISHLGGWVGNPDDDHKPTVGVEIEPGSHGHTIDGGLAISKYGARDAAFRVRGGCTKLDVGVFAQAGTCLEITEPIQGCAIDLRAQCYGDAVAIDFSGSGLDQKSGKGNVIRVWQAGATLRIIYPGGGEKYNLAPGTELFVDGELQTAESVKKPL